MGKNLGEVINKIMEENTSNRVMIITEHMYILGTIHDYQDKCQNCHECLISLKDAKIACIKDLSECRKDESECNNDIFTTYRWFNINANSIVGFSILHSNE